MRTTNTASAATVPLTGFNSWYMRSDQARWNATPAMETRNPNRNSASLARMLWAVAAASPVTTRLPRMKTWPVDEPVPSSASNTPAILALARGDSRFRAVKTRATSSAQPERRVLIGHQRERIPVHPVGPPQHSDDEIEQATGIRAGEENREPSGDHREHHAKPQEEQDDVVRDGQKPLDQRQPAVQLPGIWIGEVKMDGLLLVGRGIAVVQQGQIHGD